VAVVNLHRVNLVISNIVLKVLYSDSTLNFSKDNSLDPFSRFGFDSGTIFPNMTKLVKNWPKRLVKNIFSTACMLLLYLTLLGSYSFDICGIE